MPTLNVNDVTLYYECYGEGEPLVFIAGFASDHVTWLHLLPIFSQHFQVILFDNRGAGRSSVPNYPYTIDMMADDVYQLCQTLQLKKAHFIGSSMGGKIVQNLGYRYPQICNKLVISNSFSTISPNFKLFAQALLTLKKAKAPPRPLIEQVLSWIFSGDFLQKEGNVTGLVEMNLNNPYPISIEGYENQLATAEGFDSAPYLPQIKAPCLLLASADDIVAPAKGIQAMADSIPQAEYYCFKQSGHLPHFEVPDEFSQVVLEFLQR